MKNKVTLYERKGVYTLEGVFKHVIAKRSFDDLRAKKHYVDFDGDLVKMDSQRYFLFKFKGCTCVACGLGGTFFAKEKSYGQLDAKYYHFNLYGIKDGKEVLFTKDHIVPRSLGGKDNMTNYQTMCVTCNNEKGNKPLINNL